MKRVAFLLVTFVVTSSIALLAQQDTATIVGAVRDTSGAVVPNTKITVSNPDKGFSRELVTNSAGEYTAAALPIGNYVLTAESQGFDKVVRTQISVTVGQVLRVDFELRVGQVTQEITVAGNVAKVERRPERSRMW